MSQSLIKKLIKDGEDLVKCPEISETEVILATTFSEGIGILLNSKDLSEVDPKELEKLTQIHQKVLARLKSQRDVVGKSLKGIRHKGKGIRAYLDQKRGRAQTLKKGKNS